MADFVAVMAWDANMRVTKHVGFGSLAEAQAHVAANQADYLNAFAAAVPPGSTWYTWLVQAVGPRFVLTFSPRGTADTQRESAVSAAVRRIAQEFDPATEAEILAILDRDN